ncbi:hypothetical protein DM40_5084 [Burkholderia cenocepacia]|nr:hypothetical protein DM40_5084 [Burkholderia cenocepacia]
MNEDRETQIRERAYRLWQADGSPDGRADEYWLQAEWQIDAQRSSEDDGAEAAADGPIAQSAKRRIPGDPLQDTGAIPASEIAHEKRRTR